MKKVSCWKRVKGRRPNGRATGCSGSPCPAAALAIAAYLRYFDCGLSSFLLRFFEIGDLPAVCFAAGDLCLGFLVKVVRCYFRGPRLTHAFPHFRVLMCSYLLTGWTQE